MIAQPSPSLSLNQWLARLEKNHPVEIDLGLDRIGEVARRLNLPRPARRVVTVAGTNGKGSCVRTLEHFLLACGLSVGAYTSPHLLRYNERIRIGGEEAPDGEICNAFAAIEASRGEVSLTYFEVGTLAALLLMAAADLDVVVLEVGLGGRFDAVNLIAADIAVITSIDIDHASWLGNTREQIALEKAGIARSRGRVVVADEDPPASLRKHLADLSCRTFYIHEDFHIHKDSGCRRAEDKGFSLELARADGFTNHAMGDRLILTGLPLPALPLPSVAAAFQAALLLGVAIAPDILASTCRDVALAGRFQQYLYRGRRVVLDVAHNPAAAAFLCERLASQGAQDLTLVAAIMADKDAEGFVAALAPVAGCWYTGNLAGVSRALAAEQLSSVVYTGGHRVVAAEHIEDAFDAALDDTEEGGLVVVCGSFFTVAAIMRFMGV